MLTTIWDVLQEFFCRMLNESIVYVLLCLHCYPRRWTCGSLHLTMVGGLGMYDRHRRVEAEMSVRASFLKM